MIWKNIAERYGVIHKTLHWIIMLLVLMMLVQGFIMDDIPNQADKFWVYSLHKSMGITVLFLMLVRLGWKIYNKPNPLPLPNHKSWERALATFIHWGFYVLLLAQPLTGWLMTGAANSTINWFGFFVVPNLNAPNPEMRDIFRSIHDTLPLVIITFILLHVAGAVKHAVIDRDKTLNRMVPFAPVALVLMAMIPAIARADDAIPNWTIDRNQSALTITATQEGAPFDATFKAFDGTIAMDPKNPTTGTADIIIDLKSFDSGNKERDSSTQGKEWFDLANFPTATYKVKSFDKGAADGTYTAHGTLFLRGIERPLDLPFTLSEQEKDGVRTAHAVGE
ncbi:MAG TPA: cytochrome b/b6 domain-containing protein, partial [Alphaproteobacteria bacterium]